MTIPQDANAVLHGDTKPNGSEEDRSKTAFERLPEEIIMQIMAIASPNSFASLALINRRWRQVSSQTYLYAHHLSMCSSFESRHSILRSNDEYYNLVHLRQLFAREIRRNLFDSYLRPNETIISLVTSNKSSLSMPESEAFRFTISPQGHFVIATTSCQIHILDVTEAEVTVKRSMEILKRPRIVTITDDGFNLAVLSPDLEVDIYNFSEQQPRLIRTIALEKIPRTIALSPKGSILAAAYDSGIEVSSLNTTSSCAERRTVKCYTVDSLSFSRDGAQILGTTLHSEIPGTVVLTAPYCDPSVPQLDERDSTLWTTSILFPNGSRDCSHAVLVPYSSEKDANWAFVYDKAFETFRAVRIDDLRNGTTYFTGPVADSFPGSKLLPSTIPAANEFGELVAAVFDGSIWLYGIPGNLSSLSIYRNGNSNRYDDKVFTHSSDPNRSAQYDSPLPSKSLNELSNNTRKIPSWQCLHENSQNTFIQGRKISFLDSANAIAWVNSNSIPCNQRLIAVASGDAGYKFTGEDHSSKLDHSGHIMIIDFDYSSNNGGKRVTTLQVGLSKSKLLDERNYNTNPDDSIICNKFSSQRYKNHGNSTVLSNTVNKSETTALPPISLDKILPKKTEASTAAQKITSEQLKSTEKIARVLEKQKTFGRSSSMSSHRSSIILRRAARAAAINRELNSQSAVRNYLSKDSQAENSRKGMHENDTDTRHPPSCDHTLNRELANSSEDCFSAESSAPALQQPLTHITSTLDLCRPDTSNLILPTNKAPKLEFPFQQSFNHPVISTSHTFNLEYQRKLTMSCLPSASSDDRNLNDSSTVNPLSPSIVTEYSSDSDALSNIIALVATDRSDSRKLQQNKSAEGIELQRIQITECDISVKSPAEIIPNSQSQKLCSRDSAFLHCSRPVSPSTNPRLISKISKSLIENQSAEVFLKKTLMQNKSNTSVNLPCEKSFPQLSQRESLPEISGLVLPNPDQIERLNSRKGRPTGLKFHRRHPGIKFLQKNNSSTRSNNSHYFSKKAPRHFLYMHSSSILKQDRLDVSQQCSQNKSEPASQALNKARPTSSSRPSIKRLETIYSQDSSSGTTPRHIPNQILSTRIPHTAESSIFRESKNIAKTSWKPSFRWSSRLKQIHAPTAGSVQKRENSVGLDKRTNKTEKAVKCAVM